MCLCVSKKRHTKSKKEKAMRLYVKKIISKPRFSLYEPHHFEQF